MLPKPKRRLGHRIENIYFPIVFACFFNDSGEQFQLQFGIWCGFLEAWVSVLLTCG